MGTAAAGGQAFSSPSAFSVSTTFGRAPMRPE
jgi:hypothetical protein